MDNLNASQVSREVQDFTKAVRDGRGFADITQIIQMEVQRQLEQQLIDFQAAVAQSNLAMIDVMHTELTRLKEESATVKGVMERLASAVAPDISATEDEVVSFRQAIDNLEKYGSIIPSSADIAAAQIRWRNQQAWSLFWQSVAKMFIKKLEKVICKPPTSTEPTGVTSIT
ncbi:hypothetical protein LC605_25935 [Nostoc sp. CHAB 5836]|uniref:hypothetical protein n=1 Tax=Nostoc sp. CHAB 5836 TaxID=2780404 RepID=UPI001E41749F|nr:hypothetical protein [Nostoc sp. CHAB 5836]MCC5618464.1 hypothetical protein [Nostoc sp. CHAB 5836]